MDHTIVIEKSQVGREFNQLIDQIVENQQTIVVENDGNPLIVLITIEEYERLRGIKRDSIEK